MARPPKNPSERKNVDIRIPVTPDQKQLITDALDGQELAGWARDLILKGARELIDQRKRKRPGRPS